MMKISVQFSCNIKINENSENIKKNSKKII